MDKKRTLPSLLLVGGFWLLLSLCCWLQPSSDYSLAERRPLQQPPALQIQALLQGSYMTDFEAYALDQFPARDGFRTIKALSSYYGFQMVDNNGIYLKNGYASKLEYPLQEANLRRAADHLQDLYALCEDHRSAYLCIIPDKNYYLAGDYPHLDYDRLYAQMAALLPQLPLVDLRPQLTLEDYYRTDTHWRQTCLVDIAAQLAAALEIPFSDDFSAQTLSQPFYGVYSAQAALPLPGEPLTLLYNDAIDASTVYHVETDQTGPVYDLTKASGPDPYAVYLSGAAAVLQIDNPTVENGRRLLVFRDSFAGPLIPLLLQGYEAVTLIDTRYISPEQAAEYIDATDSDVLFLYSTILLNNAVTLR